MFMFSYTLTFLLWGYVVAVLYARYVTTFVEGVRASFINGELAGGAGSGTVFRVSLDFVMFLTQTYILCGWSAYTVLKIRKATHLPDAGSPFIYYIIGVGACMWALGYIAHHEKFQGILSILHSVMAMGSCVIFAIRPQDIPVVYGWMVHLMGGLV